MGVLYLSTHGGKEQAHARPGHLLKTKIKLTGKICSLPPVAQALFSTHGSPPHPPSCQLSNTQLGSSLLRNVRGDAKPSMVEGDQFYSCHQKSSFLI